VTTTAIARWLPARSVLNHRWHILDVRDAGLQGPRGRPNVETLAHVIVHLNAFVIAKDLNFFFRQAIGARNRNHECDATHPPTAIQKVLN